MRGRPLTVVGAALLLAACRTVPAVGTQQLVPRDGRRLVVAPTELVCIPRVGPLTTDTLVLIRFSTPWGNEAPVAGVFLVLEPQRWGERGAGPVAIRVARVLEPWTRAQVGPGRIPRLSRAEIAVVATAAAERPTWIDITSIVLAVQKERPDDPTIALIVDGPAPVAFSAAEGPAPRIDVYLR